MKRQRKSIKVYLLRTTWLLALVFSVVLAYGYWHSVTHASFNVTMSLKDGSEKGYQAMPLAKISFLDHSGRVLAKGVADEKYNYVHLLHPEVGDCHDLAKGSATSSGRTAWQGCFATMSTWIPQWAEDVKQANVFYQGQSFANIPVKVSAYNSEWFYWWVPLPHIGGKPYTYYRARISVDSAK